MRWWMVAAVSGAMACSGGKQVVQRSLSADRASTGSVEIRFTRRAANVSVAVNGSLVVDSVQTERIRIDGIDSGYADLAIAGDGVERQLRVWVDAQRVTAIPVAIDTPRQTNPLLMAALSILALIISQGVNDLMF